MNLKTSENFYNNLVQILVQKVIQHQKKPVTIGFFLYSLMPIAGIRKHLRNTVLSILLIHLVKFWSMNLLSLFFFNRPITA